MRADVAIIIATAGERPTLLATCLRSIRTARYTAWCRGISTEIVIERDEERTGVAATLLRGLAKTNSTWTSFWGDDDYMAPDYIWRHVRCAEYFDVMANSMILADAELHRTGERHLPVARLADFLEGNVTVNDGAFIRASSRVAFKPWRGRAMMMTFWMDMLAAGRRFGVIDEPLWTYRQHPGQLSASWSPVEMALRDLAIAEHAA